MKLFNIFVTLVFIFLLVFSFHQCEAKIYHSSHIELLDTTLLVNNFIKFFGSRSDAKVNITVNKLSKINLFETSDDIVIYELTLTQKDYNWAAEANCIQIFALIQDSIKLLIYDTGIYAPECGSFYRYIENVEYLTINNWPILIIEETRQSVLCDFVPTTEIRTDLFFNAALYYKKIFELEKSYTEYDIATHGENKIPVNIQKYYYQQYGKNDLTIIEYNSKRKTFTVDETGEKFVPYTY